MRTLLRVIRGLLGIGAVGAIAGGGLVAVLAAVVQLIDGSFSLQFIGYGFLAGAGLGLATTTVFGAVLAATSRGRRLEELSFWRATAVSGVLGASLPRILGALGGDAVPPFAAEAPAIVICGLFGAFLGGGLVALGKEARLRELQDGNTDDKLIEKIVARRPRTRPGGNALYRVPPPPPWERRPITMRVPPPRATRAPGYTAPGHEPSPLCAARLMGLRVAVAPRRHSLNVI
jgi:type IV secretory pathway VirB3-like protein